MLISELVQIGLVSNYRLKSLITEREAALKIIKWLLYGQAAVLNKTRERCSETASSKSCKPKLFILFLSKVIHNVRLADKFWNTL